MKGISLFLRGLVIYFVYFSHFLNKLQIQSISKEKEKNYFILGVNLLDFIIHLL